jgi:putative lipoic acid-binding regulatory protein
MTRSADQSNGRQANGHGDGTDAELVAAMERQHDFPGFYPVVVIARRDVDFEARLRGAVAAQQGAAPWRITERRSRRGNYVSYRVELHVDTARIALARKAVLAGLRGVLVIL